MPTTTINIDEAGARNDAFDSACPAARRLPGSAFYPSSTLWEGTVAYPPTRAHDAKHSPGKPPLGSCRLCPADRTTAVLRQPTASRFRKARRIENQHAVFLAQRVCDLLNEFLAERYMIPIGRAQEPLQGQALLSKRYAMDSAFLCLRSESKPCTNVWACPTCSLRVPSVIKPARFPVDRVQRPYAQVGVAQSTIDGRQNHRLHVGRRMFQDGADLGGSEHLRTARISRLADRLCRRLLESFLSVRLCTHSGRLTESFGSQHLMQPLPISSPSMPVAIGSLLAEDHPLREFCRVCARCTCTLPSIDRRSAAPVRRNAANPL